MAGVVTTPALARQGKCIVEVEGDRFIDGPCDYRYRSGTLSLLSEERYLLVVLRSFPGRDGHGEAIAARVKLDGSFAEYPLGASVVHGSRLRSHCPLPRQGQVRRT
jgi:hypothetical protein